MFEGIDLISVSNSEHERLVDSGSSGQADAANWSILARMPSIVATILVSTSLLSLP